MEYDPPPMPGVTPYVNVKGASEASAFYQRAFGATELMRLPGENGTLMHCHLTINGGAFMISDCCTESGAQQRSAEHITMHLHVEDVQAWWARAVEAGAETTLPLQVMFWGDRYGRLRDPFGVSWSLASPA
jgi:PhnB protein